MMPRILIRVVSNWAHEVSFSLFVRTLIQHAHMLELKTMILPVNDNMDSNKDKGGACTYLANSSDDISVWLEIYIAGRFAQAVETNF